MDSAQQDSVAHAGPTSTTQTLSFADDVTYADSGPFQFGQYTTGLYENGRRVLWPSGADRITKLDYDTQEIIDTYPLPNKPFYDVEQGEEIIEKLNTLPVPVRFGYMVCELVPMLMDLSGVYTLLDVDNTFYVGVQSLILAVRELRFMVMQLQMILIHPSP